MSPRPSATTCSELIRAWARYAPEDVALTFEGVHTTVAEFDGEVDRWARALLAAGVQRGDAVSILCGNHPDFLRLSFAAARVGAHLAPLNTWHKPEELRYTLDHSDAVVLLAVDRLRNQDFNAALATIIPELTSAPAPDRFGRFPSLRQVVALGSALPRATPLGEFLRRADEVGDAELHAREKQNAPDDLMFLLYTSGSTSKPKAVQIHQGPLIENGYQIGERQGIEPADRSWLATPLFYGLAAEQALMAAWTHRARVVLQEVFDAPEALEILARERCTVYYGFGNLTRKLLATPGFDRSRIHLRKGMIGFSVEDRQLAIDRLGVTHGVSVYGMTEMYGLVALTQHTDTRETVLSTQGFPLPGNEIRIVDPDSETPLPQGEIGAIQVRGRVTTGYFKDSDRTKASFTGDGFFRTGDLGSLDAEGRLVYHARATEMLKPGGVNVAPQEIEALLDEIPGIQQAHVCSVPDTRDGEVVVAFIEADPEATPPELIRERMRARAASYKVPRHFIYRSDAEMPRVASGKIPRPLLREEAARVLAAIPAGPASGVSS
ncbi:class I adenylate-forming enzyme family protein [Saccharopolyspora phatthalungensis]|uniref:Fatty-acyl-CoA synthase n=1 Tax=Saccharopolyspora phatthalungensis TaxID=664693 RepID=A0A840QJ81_9PSEU|nr:class I adenylate-forming enzyme family protein [Saccharopolyspora phatthalungensis]MBB5158969.1 fatty-acyl-CoA synthase [Saccharopolyspora phatthalungensis]